ncbi:hypothetical protein KCP70_02685 [Salmonella enterica subsp. enterica]|nr:hypothetical protein KCP70_02685 [Salmonella enterica subsp. enterica]
MNGLISCFSPFDPQILREEHYLQVTDLPKIEYIRWGLSALCPRRYFLLQPTKQQSIKPCRHHVIDGKRLYAAVTRNNELRARSDTLKNADRNTLPQIKFFPLKSMNKHLSGKRVTKTSCRVVPLPAAEPDTECALRSTQPMLTNA